jgi:hypothetical protein
MAADTAVYPPGTTPADVDRAFGAEAWTAEEFADHFGQDKLIDALIDAAEIYAPSRRKFVGPDRVRARELLEVVFFRTGDASDFEHCCNTLGWGSHLDRLLRETPRSESHDQSAG